MIIKKKKDKIKSERGRIKFGLFEEWDASLQLRCEIRGACKLRVYVHFYRRDVLSRYMCGRGEKKNRAGRAVLMKTRRFAGFLVRLSSSCIGHI